MRERSGTDVDRALEIVRNGGLVAIPTETVYGLAADADDPDAVARIFAAKGRPADHPLIVHVASGDDLPAWADDPSPEAMTLAASCWPGPLTLVVPRARRVIDAVTGGRDTVGVRVPAHPLTGELLRRFGGGLAAPSANRFGHVSPTTAHHVLDDLGIAVDYVLDGGPCEVGVESTIVDCTVSPLQVLRHGGLPLEDLERIVGGALAEAAGPSRAPGMLLSHYAPACRVEVVPGADAAAARRADLIEDGQRVEVVGLTDDLVEYARHLYTTFRDAEARGTDVILAVEPPAQGLGHAIRDRLRKASAPRR